MAITEQEQQPATALPPGPRRLPYLGNLLSLRQDPLGFLQRLQQTYGRMATIYVGKNPAVLLFRPEHVRYVLVEHPGNFSNRGLVQGPNNGGFASEGLLTIDGEKHRQQRRGVQPAFHKSVVEGYAQIMGEYTQEVLKTWQPGDEVDLSRVLQELTLRIISKCLFSIDLSSQLAPLSDAFDGVIGSSTSMAEDLLNIRIDNPITGYGRRMAATRQLDMLIYTLISQRRESDQGYHDVLSLLLTTESGDEAGATLSDKQIHDHILTFLAAGHETTAISLVWTFYLLAQHTDIRTNLQHEINTVIGERKPTLTDLAQMPLLDKVLSESMRLYPPAWLQMRFVTKESEIDGVRLPVGTMLILSQWVIHRLPDIWQGADQFKPERRDPEQKQSTPPGAYFPFGGGPRTCIGMPLAQMEAKMILVSMLQRYTPQPAPGYTPGFQPVITLRPKRHLLVTSMPASSRESDEKWMRRAQLNAMARQEGEKRQGCRGVLSRSLGLR